jgi:hypothetical protein
MGERVTVEHVVRQARLHHVLFSLGGIYFGQYNGTWSGTLQRGWYAWSDGQGNQASLAWKSGQLIGVAFDHESDRSEWQLDEDEREPLKWLKGLPPSLRAWAAKHAADFENLATAGFWSAKGAVKFSDPMTHGLDLFAGFELEPSAALTQWLPQSSLTEAHAQLALRLAGKPGPINAADQKVLLALPPGVKTIDVANAKQAKADLKAAGIEWKIPLAAIRALANAERRQLEAKIDAAMNPFTRALFEAARSDDAAAVKKLLAGGAELDAATVAGQFPYTPRGDSPLIQACKAKSARVAVALLNAGADVRAENEYRQDALTWAARSRLVEVAKRLIARGADPAHADDKGETALLWAAQEGLDELVDMLLAAGARPGMRTRSGVTAAERAGMHQHLELAQRLRALE